MLKPDIWIKPWGQSSAADWLFLCLLKGLVAQQKGLLVKTDLPDLKKATLKSAGGHLWIRFWGQSLLLMACFLLAAALYGSGIIISSHSLSKGPLQSMRNRQGPLGQEALHPYGPPSQQRPAGQALQIAGDHL